MCWKSLTLLKSTWENGNKNLSFHRGTNHFVLLCRAQVTSDFVVPQSNKETSAHRLIVRPSCVLRKHTQIIELVLTCRTLWTAFISYLILCWTTREAETTEDCHQNDLNDLNGKKKLWKGLICTIHYLQTNKEHQEKKTWSNKMSSNQQRALYPSGELLSQVSCNFL